MFLKLSDEDVCHICITSNGASVKAFHLNRRWELIRFLSKQENWQKCFDNSLIILFVSLFLSQKAKKIKYFLNDSKLNIFELRQALRVSHIWLQKLKIFHNFPGIL